ncbi:hypothetical protein KEF85_14370 [Methylomonas paludis]|uniref:Uncharacterized protein n=1 Tax=Methylomonas paludis TaxID=1173101 RepID=A0A975MMB1_9GAMM|nr:hypothetical protein [Methylomonas paludis]QWF70501.1 hypothetical protein KEF85_14370 [Methylomonas paludis]
MYRYSFYACSHCGRKHDSIGRLGTAKQCDCGNWLPQAELDRVRYYWIAQISLCFAVAAFFISFALSYSQLPSDPWQRFCSPVLQVPAVAAFLVSYRILLRYKNQYDTDDLMFRYYLFGVCLMSLGFIASLLEAAQ